MYVDTDVVLATVKVDDWLASSVDIDSIDAPITSVATCIEVHYAMEDDWGRERLTRIHELIEAHGVSLVALETGHVDAGMTLLRSYDRLNQFDAIHLGVAWMLEEPIVSTDTLYPSIDEIDHIDPRDVE